MSCLSQLAIVDSLRRTTLKSRAVRLFALLFPLFISSCSNDMEKVKFFDRQSLPSQTLSNALVYRSAEGVLQVEVKAPSINKYEVPQPKTIYPQGVEVSFYGQGQTVDVNMKARYAVSWDDKGIMMARDSVVVVDFRSGDTIYLQNIIWNQNEHRVFSNQPVRAKNGQCITIGDSFHSDESFHNLQIVNQRGIIEMKEE